MTDDRWPRNTRRSPIVNRPLVIGHPDWRAARNTGRVVCYYRTRTDGIGVIRGDKGSERTERTLHANLLALDTSTSWPALPIASAVRVAPLSPPLPPARRRPATLPPRP